MFKCQMSNVDKVKLLSERTSGVPPFIFHIHVARVIANYKLRGEKKEEGAMQMKRLHVLQAGIRGSSSSHA